MSERPTSQYWRCRRGLPRLRSALAAGHARVLVVGGSVSHGPASYAARVRTWFLREHPACDISWTNLAVPGNGSELASVICHWSLQREHDLVLVETAVVDRNYVAWRRWRALESLLRCCREHDCDALLVHATSAQMEADLVDDGTRGARVIRDAERLGAWYGFPSALPGACLANEAVRAGVPLPALLPDGLHPTPRGTAMYASVVQRALVAALAVEGGHESLPAPLDRRFWRAFDLLPLPAIASSPPWEHRPSGGGPPLFEELTTRSLSHPLSFNVSGRGVIVGVMFDGTSADFTFRLDGGPERNVELRVARIQPPRWYRMRLLTDALDDGEHTVTIHPTPSPRCDPIDQRFTLAAAVAIL